MATVESAYGRPEDKDIEKEFMKKIRGDKLQAINAECELEICLAFKHGNKQKPGKKSRSKNKDVEEGNETLGSRIQLLIIGNSGKFDVNKREQLEVQFKQLKEAWKFEEIEENNPLPDYFFDDGCDLSYIIYELQKKDPNHKEMFSAEELIFLEILCLDGRNHLSGAILDYYTKNMELMIDAMNNGLEKITNKLEDLKIKNKSRSKDKKGQGEEVQSENLNSHNDFADLGSENQEEDEDDENEKKPKKTKGISKPAKKTEKGKKRKKSEDNEPSEEEEENPDSEKELALKTINYITWAYWYVIPKE